MRSPEGMAPQAGNLYAVICGYWGVILTSIWPLRMRVLK